MKHMRIIVIFGLLAIVVLPAALAAKQHDLSVSCQVVVTYTKATYNCTSSQSTRLRYNAGVDPTLGRMSYDDQPGVSHQLPEEGLTPSTHYLYTASARVKGAWKVLYRGWFNTSNPGQATAGVSGGNITLDGSPFFPIVGLVACPNEELVDDFVTMGASTFLGDSVACPTPPTPSETVDRMLRNKAFWIDLRPPVNGPPLREFLDLYTVYTENRPRLDAVIFWAHYLNGCSGQAIDHSAVGLEDRIRQWVKQSPWGTGYPIFTRLTLLSKFGPNQPNCLTPKKLDVLFSVPPCAGAKGVLYDAFGRLSNGENIDAKPAIQKRAGQEKARWATWGPTFYAPSVAVKRRTAKLVACAHIYHGVTYVTAINVTDQPVKSRLSVTGVGNRKAFRYVEGAKVKVSRTVFRHGSHSDIWPPYGKLVYVLP